MLLLAGSLAAACGPGAAGEAVRPATPSAARAIEAEAGEGAAVQCRPGAYAEPLVVDLSASARVDFEAAMDSSVALVNYDCKAVRLLKDCRLAGDYRFAGVSRKEEIIHLDNRDEIRANLPLGQGKLGGEMERASALDIAFVLVGKRTTPALVHRGVLEGSQCGEATHFVKAATVGAFAIQTSTKGRAAVAAEVFTVSAGGESSSARQTAKKDGNPQACEQSKPGADAPPAECRSAIRFELVPVSDKAPEGKDDKGDKGKSGKGDDRSAKALEDPCPEGFKLTAGKCAKAEADQPQAHLCAPRDVADCEKQCAAGHPGSCYNLGSLAYDDYGKPRVSAAEASANIKRALDLWKGACDAGVFKACTDYGFERTSDHEGLPADPKAAHAALARACDGGDADGCYYLASDHLKGNNGLEKDAPTGVVLLRRGCKLGDRLSCSDLGEYYFAGKYIARDPAAGDKLLSPFCAQGDRAICVELAEHLLGLYDDDGAPEKPVAEIADAKPRGRALLAKICSQGGASACITLARLQADDNDPKGRAALARYCPDEGDVKRSACGQLGRLLVEGKAGPADKPRGVEALLKSGDDALVFRAAQMLDRGDGVKKDAARAKKLMETLCSKEDYKPACEASKPGGKPAGKAPAAKKK